MLKMKTLEFVESMYYHVLLMAHQIEIINFVFICIHLIYPYFFYFEKNGGVQIKLSILYFKTYAQKSNFFKVKFH